MKRNDYLRYFIIAGLFAVLLIPLVVTNSLFFPFITGKGFLFRLIVELIFGAYVILALYDADYRPRFSWLLGASGIFLVIVLIADSMGLNVEKSFWSNFERMEGWVTHLHLFLYFLVAGAVLNTEKLWNAFFKTSLGVSTALCGYGFLQLAGAFEIHQGGRLDATLGNATYFAVYLLIHIFLGIYFLLREGTSKAGKIFYAVLTVLQLVILYYTETRGAILGLLTALGIGLITYAVLEKSNVRGRKISLGILAVVIAVVAIFISIKNTPFVQHNKVLSRFAQIGLADAGPRLSIWKMAGQGFKERPILGWGQENFNYVFNKYYDPKLYSQEQWFDRAHNVFFDWLIAAGILGLLGYLSLFALAFYYVWGRREYWKMLIPALLLPIVFALFFKVSILGAVAASFVAFGIALYLISKKYPFEEKTYQQQIVLTSLLVAYFVHNIFVFDNLISYIFFFSFLAFLHMRNSREISTFTRLNIESETGRNTAAIVLAVAALFAVWFVNSDGYLANRALIKALTPNQKGPAENLKFFKQALAYDTFGNAETREQLAQFALNVASEPSLPQDLKQEFFALAMEQFQKQIVSTPEDARYHMFAGTLLSRLKFYKEATPYFEKAAELSPNKQTLLFELGLNYFNTDHKTEAQNVFKRAYELEPSYQDARMFYAMAAIANKDQKLGESLLVPIFGTDEVNDERIIKAYLQAKNYQKLINIFKKVSAENPSNVDSRVSLAVSYLNAGFRSQAIAELQEIVKINPSYKAEVDRLIGEIRAGRNPTN
jgi:O-antigen ligase/cytochrome c-type biogenesis protein CcmH/NrfG